MINSNIIKELIKLQNKAILNNEIPISALIVHNNKVIAKGYNKKNSTNNPLDHAEISCIKKACKYLNNWRLNECIMYVVLKPCPMCASAIRQSRINKIVYFVNNLNEEQNNIVDSILSIKDINPKVEIEYIYNKDMNKNIKDFFSNRRV